jgi:hypothetical protein
MTLDLRNLVSTAVVVFVSSFVSQNSLAEAPYINQERIRYCAGQWGDGDCQFRDAILPDLHSVSELRNFVQALEVRMTALETENTSLKRRLSLLESYPSNQCTIEVVGTCSTVSGWSNRSFADASGMLLKNTGLDLNQCKARAKAYFDHCRGGVTVFATFTNSRQRFKFPTN